MNKTVTKHFPKHVAIIMDGNMRWAQRQGISSGLGHRAGAEKAQEIIKKALELGVRYLTLYAFSSENWSRPQSWVADIMNLFRYYLNHRVEEIIEWGVRIRVIGERERLPKDIVNLIESLEEKTCQQTKIQVIFALSYGGRDEVVRATRRIAEKAQKGELDYQEISLTTISEHLDTKDVPDPDLLIRTSGEKRLSNFLLWQLAYAEFIFIDVLWPDFTKQHFEEALHEFTFRERRYGRIKADSYSFFPPTRKTTSRRLCGNHNVG